MIELSVGIPLFKSDKIAWLPMESLCNQIGIDFEWELIACEEHYYENDNLYCGKDFFESYRDRLYKVGCRDIKFIDLENYVTLENKWRFMVDASNKCSKILTLQASDNYSQNDRIATAFKHVKAGADWIHYDSIYFYNCKKGQLILRKNDPQYYSTSTSSKGVNISIRMELIKDMPFRDQGYSVDGWLFEMAKRSKPDIIQVWNGGNWGTGICTDGFNRISLRRVKHYDNPKPPFYNTDKNINDLMPVYIVNRLVGIRNQCLT